MLSGANQALNFELEHRKIDKGETENSWEWTKGKVDPFQWKGRRNAAFLVNGNSWDFFERSNPVHL